jgi:microcystin-dependent protein
MQTALQTEGIFPGAVVATPVFRWKPRRDTTTNRPAADAVSPGSLYVNTTTNAIERDNGTTWDEVASLTPPGAIQAYGGATAPGGWLLCDGTSCLRTAYPALFTAIGTAFGAADGAHFNVPDFRGRFLRGTDSAAGRDPNAATRTAMNTGGNTADNVGSIQAENVKSHQHTIALGSDAGSGGMAAYGQTATTGINTGLYGGDETRPINAGVNFIIKI